MATRYKVRQTETDAIQWDGSNATAITDMIGRGATMADLGDGSWELNSPVLYAVLKVGDWVLDEGDSFRSLPGSYFGDIYETK
ncbi:MAG: hypothetical protein V3V08_23340 [Nannocystaceae bacterium]